MLDFKKEIILENERVLLRPLLIEDIEHLLQYALKEPSLWQYSLISANSESKMRSYINKSIEDRTKEDSYPFIVYDKRKQAFAGSTRFYDYQKTHNTTQLGYTWYGKEFWGTGLNKNCKFLMLTHAFDELGLERVEFRADNKNERSIAAMKSLGCTPEGILRSNCASETGRRDSIILSILRDEWQNDLCQKLKVRL